MAFIGLLPFFLWAGWSLGCELYDRMASVLGWLVVLGIVFCVLGLAGQLQWQVLVTGETAHSFVLPDASFYPEYFSFPLLCMSKNNAKISKNPVVWLPVIAFVISSGYALGLTLLFGTPQAYPGYELLRAWSFGGISRFDAAFLLLWLAAAIFRFGFIVRAVRLLCERLAEGPVMRSCTMTRRGWLRLMAAGVLVVWLCLFLHWDNTEKSMIRAFSSRPAATAGQWSAVTSSRKLRPIPPEAKAAIRLCIGQPRAFFCHFCR